MNMRRPTRRRRDAAVGRGRRRGAWALFVAGVAYVSVLAFLRSAAAPASRPPAFVLPPPEPWDPSRLRPPLAPDAARRGAAAPRATGGAAAPDAGDPLAALRAASREALGAPRARAAPAARRRHVLRRAALARGGRLRRRAQDADPAPRDGHRGVGGGLRALPVSN